MSHFTVLVVDTNNEKSVDEWMEPFYEGLEKDRISDWGVQDTLKYLKDHNVDFPYDYVNETNLEEYLAVVKKKDLIFLNTITKVISITLVTKMLNGIGTKSVVDGLVC